MDTRRLFVAMAAALAVFIAWQYFVVRFLPPPAPTPTPPGADARPATPDGSGGSATIGSPGSAPADGLRFDDGAPVRTIVLGGRDDPAMHVELNSLGATVTFARLTARLKSGLYVHRLDASGNEPFAIMNPVVDPDPSAAPAHVAASFATSRIHVEQLGRRDWSLGDVVWDAAPDPGGRKVTFTTTLRSPEQPQGLLRVRKTYELDAAKPLLLLTLQVENLSSGPLDVVLTQDGPVGVPADDPRTRTNRRVVAAFRKSDGGFQLEHAQRDALYKQGAARLFTPADAQARLLWAAVADKYFAVFVRPLGTGGADAPLAATLAALAAPELSLDAGDATARFVTRPVNLPAAGAMSCRFEVYAGPKDHDLVKAVNPLFVDAKGLNYAAIRSLDMGCCVCTFEPLPTIMTWLMDTVYRVVRNYGVSIVVLVIIVRTLLHPLSVFQQKSMYRMQESMGRIQPKMAAIKEKFPNDKVRQNQEMMKLWAEENVNPAASFISMVPMFIQMPILVALWTTVNFDIHLRNAPFDGWWIRDLSQPDAFLRFGGQGVTIPILGWLPLIGPLFSNIHSLNLMPILMGVSMYLQQKYMPKPAQQAKLDHARAQAPHERPPGGGLSAEDQIRQQRMIANMMSVMFPIMFYSMPSGLTLYWMATNIYGIFESLVIRRQIEREKARPPQARPPAKSGIVSRWLRRIAEQAEQLQKAADEASKQRKK